AALGVPEHLRHVELDAHHRGAAEHLLRPQAGARTAGGARDRRAVRGTAPDAAVAAPADAALADLDQLLPGRRSGDQVVRALGTAVRAPGGGAPGGSLDARPLRRQ